MEQATQTAPLKKGSSKSKTVERVQLLDFNPSLTKSERLKILFDQWYGCRKCQLGIEKELSIESQEIVFGEGNPDAHVLIVGEAPGEEEEACSIPFIGKSGQLLNQILAMTSDDKRLRDSQEEFSKITRRTTNAGRTALKEIQDAWVEWRDTQFFITNAVACRPQENRTPNYIEIKACWERLWNIIYIVDPLVIIGAGNSAMSALLQKVQVQITKMRGVVFDAVHEGLLGQVRYPVVPIYHPSYLLRKADWNSPGGDFAKTVEDVRKALRLLDFLRNKNFGTPIPQR